MIFISLIGRVLSIQKITCQIDAGNAGTVGMLEKMIEGDFPSLFCRHTSDTF